MNKKWRQSLPAHYWRICLPKIHSMLLLPSMYIEVCFPHLYTCRVSIHLFLRMAHTMSRSLVFGGMSCFEIISQCSFIFVILYFLLY